MSDKKIEVSNIESQQPSFMQKLEKDAKKANENLAFGHVIAKSLNPAVIPDDVYLSGYCASSTLQFAPEVGASTMNEVLNSIIEAYPPIECVFVPSGPTVKPKQDLRDSEVGERAYPIRVNSHKGLSTVVWWTELKEAGTASIAVTASTDEPGSLVSPDPQKWEVKTQSYSSGHQTMYWQPRQKRAADIEIPTPHEKWLNAIEEWAKAESYRYARPGLVKHFTNSVQYGNEITAPTKEFGSFVLPEYESLNEEQKEEFLSYFKKQNYSKVREDEKAEVEKAKEWLDAFFRAHGPLLENDISTVGVTALAYLLKKDTATAAYIHWIRRTHHNGPFEVGITLNKAHIRFNTVHDMAKPYLNLEAMAEYHC